MRLLDARLVGLDADGRYLGSLPDDLGFEVAAPFMDLSTLKLTYAEDAIRSELSAPGSFLAVQVATIDTDGERGEWVEPPGCRFIASGGSWNRVADRRVWQIDCVGVGWLLGGEIVGYEGESNTDGHRDWKTATPGRVMLQLVTDAKARQWGSKLPWFRQLVSKWTFEADSSGAPWAKQYPTSAPRQESVEYVLNKLAKWATVEWEWRGFELYLANPEGALRRDLSLGNNPVILRDSQSSDAPEKFTLDELCSDVDMVGDEGLHWTFSGTDPWPKIGRRVRTISQGAVSQEGTARLYADRLLVPGAAPRVQYTRGASNGTGYRLPWIDLRNGDRVLIETDKGLDQVDVLGVSLRRDENADVAWHFTLGDRIDGLLTRMAGKADIAAAGAGVAGGDGTPPRPPGPDERVPDKVGVVAASSALYQTPDGSWKGLVSLAWPQVQRATDGTAFDRLPSYEVWMRGEGEPSARMVTTTPGAQIDISPLDPGGLYEFQVRAVSETGVAGEFSDYAVIRVVHDTDPPLVPTPPILTSQGGTVTIRWSGKGMGPNSGEPIDMPPDFRSVQVRAYGDNPNSTPVVIGDIAGTNDGDYLIVAEKPRLLVYYDFVAVDRSGNASAPSERSSIRVRSIVDDPDELNRVGAELALDSAWIGNLTAKIVTADSLRGKVIEGATIRTGPVSTDRMEMNTGGYYQMSSANGTWGKWTVNDGLCIYSDGGQLLTQLQGRSGGTGLSIRNPNNGQMTPLAPFAFGLPSAKAGAVSSEYINYSLSAGADRPGPWFESPFAADRVYFDHTGTNVQLLWSSLWVSNTDGSTDIGPNLVEQIVFIRRADTGALVLRTDLGNASGIANGVPAQEYTSSYRLNRYSAVTFDAQPLAPGSYYATSVFRAWFAYFGGSLPGWCQVRQRQILVISR